MPYWKSCVLSSHGKYLGFSLGPGAGDLSWEGPRQKYIQRFEYIKHLHLGLPASIPMYNSLAVSILGFLAQLLDPPAIILDTERLMLRKLVAGPGN